MKLVFFLLICLTSNALSLPFWAEKSVFIQGADLYAVGIATGSDIAARRLLALQNATNEIKISAGVKDISRLFIRTHRTVDIGSQTLRLVSVSLSALDAIKAKSKVNQLNPTESEQFFKSLSNVERSANSYEREMNERTAIGCLFKRGMAFDRVRSIAGKPDSEEVVKYHVRSDILVSRYGLSEIRVNSDSRLIESISGCKQ